MVYDVTAFLPVSSNLLESDSDRQIIRWTDRQTDSSVELAPTDAVVLALALPAVSW